MSADIRCFHSNGKYLFHIAIELCFFSVSMIILRYENNSQFVSFTRPLCRRAVRLLIKKGNRKFLRVQKILWLRSLLLLPHILLYAHIRNNGESRAKKGFKYFSLCKKLRDWAICKSRQGKLFCLVLIDQRWFKISRNVSWKLLKARKSFFRLYVCIEFLATWLMDVAISFFPVCGVYFLSKPSRMVESLRSLDSFQSLPSQNSFSQLHPKPESVCWNEILFSSFVEKSLTSPPQTQEKKVLKIPRKMLSL